MPIYAPGGRSRAEHERRAKQALEGIPYLTLDDLLELMTQNAALCDEHDRWLARSDLRAFGYREEFVPMWGCTRVFRRWVKMTPDYDWRRMHVPDFDGWSMRARR